MDSKEIDRAMRDRLPVVYEGHRYERISEYISWYGESGKRQLSVVLINRNYSVRAPADKVNLAEGQREGALGYKVNLAEGQREGALGYKVNLAEGQREGALGYKVELAEGEA